MTIDWTKKREAKGVRNNRVEQRKKYESNNEEEEWMILSSVVFKGSCAVNNIALWGKKNSCWSHRCSRCW